MSKQRKSSRTGLLIGLGGVVVLALVAAIVLSGGDPEELAMPTDATVSVSGNPLPPFAGDPTGDPAVGLPAPALEGEDFAGTPVAITNDGRPKVVLFLAHWCPHCQEEVPAVQSYADTTGLPDGVDLLSVATSYTPTRPNWPPSAWLAREGWSFPVLVDDPASTAFTAFGQGAFPYYVLIGADGTVALRLSGRQDPARLAAMMAQLAEG